MMSSAGLRTVVSLWDLGVVVQQPHWYVIFCASLRSIPCDSSKCTLSDSSTQTDSMHQILILTLMMNAEMRSGGISCVSLDVNMWVTSGLIQHGRARMQLMILRE